MICLFGPFNNSIYRMFHCPLFTKDWKALALFQKNTLQSHISMLDIGTYAFDLPKSSWVDPCLFGDQYTSLMNTAAKESQRVIYGPRFPKSYTRRHLKFKHPTHLFMVLYHGRASCRLATNRWFNGQCSFCQQAFHVEAMWRSSKTTRSVTSHAR